MSRDIEARATELLKQNGLFKQAVDVEALAAALKIAVQSQHLEDGFSDFFFVKEGNATAFVNSDHHPNRRRFSLAHEIGHFVLHHQPTKKLDDLFLDKSVALYTRKDHHSNDMEREANEFAASLLMPRDLLEKYVHKNDLDIEDEFDVSRLALAFGVSEQALQIRLNRLHMAVPNF